MSHSPDALRSGRGTAAPLRMQSRQPSRWQTLWLSETIRHGESEAWLDDAATLRDFRAQGDAVAHGAQSALLTRTQSLAAHNPMVAELARDIDRARSAASLLLWVFAALALLAGIGAATAVLSGLRVNIMLAWFALLGFPLISLLLWLPGSFIGTHSLGVSLGHLWGTITRHMVGAQHRMAIFQGLTRLLQNSRLPFWTSSFVSHLLWTLYFVGVTLSLLYWLSIREYAFYWETTLLSSAFFARFVGIFGWLPGLMGIAMPDPQAVMQLSENESARRAWAAWLLASSILYGLLPRAALALESLRRLYQSQQRLSLDLSDPYYFKLSQRLNSLLGQARVTDPELPEATIGLPPLSKDTSASQMTQLPSMFVAYELPPEAAWPPAVLPLNVIVGENISTSSSREQLLNHLSTAPVSRLLIACHADSTVDRGAAHFLQALAEYAQTTAVLLLEQSTAREGRVRYWKEALQNIGIEDERVFATLADALIWMEGAQDEAH